MRRSRSEAKFMSFRLRVGEPKLPLGLSEEKSSVSCWRCVSGLNREVGAGVGDFRVVLKQVELKSPSHGILCPRDGKR